MLYPIQTMGMGCVYQSWLVSAGRPFNSDYYIEAGEMSIVTKSNDMPRIYKKNYLAAVSGKASPRSAIKAFCIECMGYARTEVADCNTIECPLNMYRPYQKGDDETKED